MSRFKVLLPHYSRNKILPLHSSRRIHSRTKRSANSIWWTLTMNAWSILSNIWITEIWFYLPEQVAVQKSLQKEPYIECLLRIYFDHLKESKTNYNTWLEHIDDRISTAQSTSKYRQYCNLVIVFFLKSFTTFLWTIILRYKSIRILSHFSGN